METRKLYYEDCHLTEFSARVLTCEASDKGYWVTLDATAFYPEGGGQACDLGALGNAKCWMCRKRERPFPICATVLWQWAKPSAATSTTCADST